MDIRVIFGKEADKRELIEDVMTRSLGETVRFFTEDDKSETELLADCIYEDFVKCR